MPTTTYTSDEDILGITGPNPVIPIPDNTQHCVGVYFVFILPGNQQLFWPYLDIGMPVCKHAEVVC